MGSETKAPKKNKLAELEKVLARKPALTKGEKAANAQPKAKKPAPPKKKQAKPAGPPPVPEGHFRLMLAAGIHTSAAGWPTGRTPTGSATRSRPRTSRSATTSTWPTPS
jgi:hypothetical protein